MFGRNDPRRFRKVALLACAVLLGILARLSRCRKATCSPDVV